MARIDAPSPTPQATGPAPAGRPAPEPEVPDPNETDVPERIGSGPIVADVAVIGGGVVGHAIAWAVQRSGRSVVLIDPAPGAGASWAAAGMLAPVSEFHYQEEELLALMVRAAQLWPSFAGDLGQSTGMTLGYQTRPTLSVGADSADRTALLDLRDAQENLGLSVRPLSVREARNREPFLSPGITCAFEAPADHQVDPRLVVAALAEALAAGSAGTPGSTQGLQSGYLVRDHAHGLTWKDGVVTGTELASGRIVSAGETIVANGLQAGHLAALPQGLYLPLRPVHGDILRLAVPQHLQPLVRATVRGIVRGIPVYIVPREDGTVVIGATQREEGPVPGLGPLGTGISAGGVYQLLRDAQVLVPAVAELELLEITSRPRPATPDNGPLLGRVTAAPGPAAGAIPGQQKPTVPGLIVATGFFRHGVLLSTAAAAQCVSLLDGDGDSAWDVFRPDRFSEPSGRGPGPQPRGLRPPTTPVEPHPAKEGSTP